MEMSKYCVCNKLGNRVAQNEVYNHLYTLSRDS